MKTDKDTSTKQTEEKAKQRAVKVADFLRNIAQKIEPHKDNLPFMKLGEHLGKCFSKEFRGIRYQMTRGASPNARLCLTDDVRVFVIPIVQKFHQDGKGCVEKFEQIELILVRTYPYCYWDILRDELFQVFPNIPTALYSRKSEIIYSSDRLRFAENLANIDLPSGVIKRVEIAVAIWIRKAIEKREVVLKDLQKFQNEFPLPDSHTVVKQPL